MAASVFNENTNMYQYLTEVMNDAFEVEDVAETADDGLSDGAYRVALAKAYFKDNKKVILCGCGYLAVAIHMLILCISYGRAVAALNTAFLSGNFIYYLVFAILPFLLWMYSTTVDYWRFHNRKLAMFRLCCAHACLEVGCFIGRICGTILFPFFSRLTPTDTLTPSIIRSFSRLSLLLCGILSFLALFSGIIRGLDHEITEAELLSFRLDKLLDFRPAKEKEFAYDMRVVKDLKTGVTRTIKEKDRFLHAAANGTTGTGKTSSLFTVQIEADIEQICNNLEHQKKRVQELLHAGRICMKAPMEDKCFSLDHFAPVDEKDKDLLTDLKFKAKIAGITAMAPNASFADEVYELVKAKGLKANRLDPTLNANGKLKEGFRGFNPLYMPSGLSPIQRIIKQSQTAILFADVAQAVFDMSGQSDVYFAGLNKNITTTVTMLILLTYPFMKEYDGRQPVATDVQAVLNDFSKAKPYLDVLVEHYAKRTGNGVIINKLHPDLGMYQPIYDVIKNDLLGNSSQQLFDQCRGLRNIINSFLQNPLIKNILCSQDSVDLDAALDRGEITLVNYALELGTDATVFGLFFILSMINAVYRRPGGEIEKLPHFFYIDELPVLLHPRLEGCFSLFRQFRVGMFVAFQSLTQFEKSNSTAFLKDVILGNCSHHFVFGRAAVQEMELYEKIGGVGYKVTHMEGERGTSMFADNPSVSYDRRDTIEKQENYTGTDIRYRDFQEVFVITVDNGHAVGAFLGKVAFLPSYRRLRKNIYSVDWSKYFQYAPAAADGEMPASSEQGEGALRVPVAVDVFHAAKVKPNEAPVFMFLSGAPPAMDGETKQASDQEGDPERGPKQTGLDAKEISVTGDDNDDADDLISLGAAVQDSYPPSVEPLGRQEVFVEPEEEPTPAVPEDVERRNPYLVAAGEDGFKAEERSIRNPTDRKDAPVRALQPQSEGDRKKAKENLPEKEKARIPEIREYKGMLNL